MVRKMATENAEVLRFTKNEFSKGLPFIKVEDDEIIRNGEFYDVKSLKITQDSVLLFAYRDTKEKQLVAVFTKMAQNNSDNQIAFILNNFTQLFVFEVAEKIQLSNTISLKKSINWPYICNWQQVVVASDFPPPELG